MRNWQDALWSLVNYCGVWWDIGWGAAGLIVAVLLFVWMILKHPADMLMLSRAIICAANAMVFYSILNSGAQRISTALFVLGTGMATVMIITGWCDREVKPHIHAIRWMRRRAAELWTAAWSTPQPHPDKREDLL